jgi:hypothetical protein
MKLPMFFDCIKYGMGLTCVRGSCWFSWESLRHFCSAVIANLPRTARRARVPSYELCLKGFVHAGAKES